MAHGKGQRNGGDFRIHRRLAGKAHGHTGNAGGRIKACPSQLFHRRIVSGEHGVVIVIGQVVEAVVGLSRQGVEIREIQAAVGVPGHLGRKAVGLVPIIGRCIHQLGQGIFLHIQPDVVGQRAGVGIQAIDARMQEVHDGHRRQHPAEPLDGIPPENDHQHDAGNDDENPHRRQHLPDGIADGTAPGGKGVLPRPGYIRIEHIDEFFMGLGELGQHPGKEAENARRQITAPIFQRKTPPYMSVLWE